jgi:two-component sensor histidine kinase
MAQSMQEIDLTEAGIEPSDRGDGSVSRLFTAGEADGAGVLRLYVSGYVEDDGSGFEGNGETRGGLGLRSIRGDAALLEGTAEVYSSRKGGAGVQVCLPLRNGGG